MNEELINALKILLSDTVALKYKAQGYHWNVEGPDFKPWHSFFGDIYDNMSGATDELAEWIRMIDLNAYAPFKLTRFSELTTVPETEVSSNPLEMAADLASAIDAVTVKYVDAFDMATSARQQGLANFFADRQTAHQKLSWMLRASLVNN